MFLRIRTFAVAFLLVFFSAGNICAQQANLRVIGWNMEGNGNDIDPPTLVKQLGIKQGVDIWGLCEVRPNLFDEFLKGAKIGEQDDFDIIKGKSGKNIHLAIIFNKDRLDLIKSEELFGIFDLNENSSFRAPLVAHFRGKKTMQEFIFMVNHLASGDGAMNKKQAEALVKWVKTQTLPVIAVGDYNDFDNRPTVSIMKQAWLELEPIHKVPTFAKPLSGTIDHVFLGNRDKAIGWSGKVRVLNREDDEPAVGTFSDTPKDTDHRPLEAQFTLTKITKPVDPIDEDEPPLLRQLLKRIEKLEEKVRQLEKK